MAHAPETMLVASLAQFTCAVAARKAELLTELRKLETAEESALRVAESAARLGYRVDQPTPASASASPSPRSPRTATATPPVRPETAPPAPAPPPEGDTLAAYARTVTSLKKLSPNSSIMAVPPRVEHGIRNDAADTPTGGSELDVVKDSVAAISEQAAEAPLEPGARGRLSSRGLVPGEPIMPAIVAILRAADRPLSTAEVTVAMLQARGLDRRGPELTAVSSRVSAILGQLAKKRRVERIRVEGKRDRNWRLP